MDVDTQLLDRYARTRDADAFTQLVRRHAGMVFAVARRVTQDHHDAEEVAQGCFMELARQPAAIQGSLAGWLHKVATTQAANCNRAAGRRRRHEQAAARPEGQEPSIWEEVAPLVDAVLAELPENIRVPMVLYHFQGRNQAEVAAELGVSQSTISHRLEEGVAALREKLKAAGVVVPGVALPALLTQHAVEAVPKTLMVVLGKLAVSGVVPAVVGAASGGASGGAVMTTGVSSVASKGTAVLGMKVVAAVVLTAAVTTAGVALLPKLRPVVAVSGGQISGNSANDSGTSDELKDIITQVKAQTAQGLGDGVAILIETRIGGPTTQLSKSPPKTLMLYARQGKSRLFMRYDSGPKRDWGNPKATLPANILTPDVDEVLRFADQLRTLDLQVTDGHMWWRSKWDENNQKASLLSSQVDESGRNAPHIFNFIEDYFWPHSTDLALASSGDRLGSIELLRRPQSPSLIGLHLTLRRETTGNSSPILKMEDTFWLDTNRNDVNAEEDFTQYKNFDRKVQISYQHLEFTQLSDGQWYSTHWQRFGDLGRLDYRLTFFPGKTLDAKWFGDPTARFAGDPGSAVINALPPHVVAAARNISAAVSNSAWWWWPWAVAAGVFGAAGMLLIRQRRNQSPASPLRGAYGPRRR